MRWARRPTRWSRPDVRGAPGCRSPPRRRQRPRPRAEPPPAARRRRRVATGSSCGGGCGASPRLHRRDEGLPADRAAVDRRVLVPRPETELLVEVALERRPGRVLDVGTGSGAIALALADELPDAEIVATDTSPGALEVARANAARLGLAERVRFKAGTVPEGEDFDLVLANLPYVAERDWAGLEPEVTQVGAARGAARGRRRPRRLPRAADADRRGRRSACGRPSDAPGRCGAARSARSARAGRGGGDDARRGLRRGHGAGGSGRHRARRGGGAMSTAPLLLLPLEHGGAAARARRSSARSPRAASPSSPPTGSTASPAIRSTPARSPASTGSRAATTANRPRSCTSRRWRCASWSPSSAPAPPPRSVPCSPAR